MDDTKLEKEDIKETSKEAPKDTFKEDMKETLKEETNNTNDINDTNDINNIVHIIEQFKLYDINFNEYYEYQINNEKTKLQEEYKKYLKYCFQKNPKRSSKSKKVTTIYESYYDENSKKYNLIDKSNPKKKILITTAAHINLNEYYNKLKLYSKYIIKYILDIVNSENNITKEEREQFETIKTKYIIIEKNMNDIHILKNKLDTELVELKNKLLTAKNDLLLKYNQKKEKYSNIKVMIKEKVKTELIMAFKDNNNKIPSTSVINSISKKYNIAISDLNDWYEWINECYFYIMLNNDVTKIDETINKKTIEYENVFNNFMVKKENVEIVTV